MVPAADARGATGLPGRGRPRDPDVDRAIVNAALDVLADESLSGFSVEAVALRAGVGKATIYRRFEGREALLAAALERLRDDMPTPSAVGSSYERLLGLLESIRRADRNARSGRIMLQVFGLATTHPELVSMFYDRVMSSRRAVIVELLREGIDEGWVDPGCDLDTAYALLVGPVVLLRLWAGCGGREPSTEDVLRLVLGGVGA